MSVAGNRARDRGESANFCGVTIEGQTPTLSLSLETLGLLRREWKRGSCVNCRDVYNPHRLVGECSVCKYCEDADNKGRMQSVARRAKSITRTPKNLAQVSKATSNEWSARRSDRHIKERFGEFAVQRTQIVLGGANRAIYDKRTNELLATL